MPDFTYRGASGGSSPGLYPMLRDAYGVLAGTVTPGDVLEFSQAPDADWVPYEGGDDNDGRSEQGQGSGGEQHEDEHDGTGTDQDDDTAGTGQEEADQ